MNAQDEYRKLIADVEVVEERIGKRFLLVDECVIAENMPSGVSKADYWQEMLRTAEGVIGQLAENAGVDINAELGRIIY